jgi:hypothetical protein
MVEGVKLPGQINILSRGWFLFGGEYAKSYQAQKMNPRTLLFDTSGPYLYRGIFDANQCLLQGNTLILQIISILNLIIMN